MVKLAKSNNNQKTPEMRLWLIYPAAVLTAIGLIVWGISLDRGYHWMVGQVGFALCKFALFGTAPCLARLKLTISSTSRWRVANQ